MVQSSQTGATERSYINTALRSPWQRGNIPHFANDPLTKKRKLEASRTNVNKRQPNTSASQVTTHNRFAILEADVAMVSTTEVNKQLTQKNPSPANRHR